MNAVISGQAGVAVLVDGLKLASIHAGSDGEAVARRPAEVRFLLGDAKDLEFVDDVKPEELRRRLKVATSKYDALHLALILLDGELSHDTRRTAAEELEELLGDQAIAGWVENVLYAHPLPRSADPVGARSACTGRTERTRAFLSKLESLQMVIAEVHQAWEGIPPAVFGTTEDRAHALSVAVKAGLFRDLVAIRAAGQPVGSFLFQAFKNPAMQELRDARHVLMKWVAGFQDQQETYSAPKIAASFVAENGFTPPVRDRVRATGTGLAVPSVENAVLEDAPEELIRRYYRAVLAFFVRRGFSIEESRDLAQETFFRAYKNWASFRGESSEVTLLFGIASNLYRNAIRGKSALKRNVQEVPRDLPDGEPVTADDLPEERSRILREALESLPPQMRQAVFLRVEGDLKYREIAELMNVSIETVKAHLYQAKKQLRNKLAEYFRTDIES